MSSADVGNGRMHDGRMSPFVELLRFELRRAFRRRHGVALMSMAAMGFVLAVWLPMFPESVLQVLPARLPTRQLGSDRCRQ